MPYIFILRAALPHISAGTNAETKTHFSAFWYLAVFLQQGKFLTSVLFLELQKYCHHKSPML
jgi:hypothetical protein